MLAQTQAHTYEVCVPHNTSRHVTSILDAVCCEESCVSCCLRVRSAGYLAISTPDEAASPFSAKRALHPVPTQYAMALDLLDLVCWKT